MLGYYFKLLNFLYILEICCKWLCLCVLVLVVYNIVGYVCVLSMFDKEFVLGLIF